MPPGEQGDVDRLLFGDNQFFGVNHISEEAARRESMRFNRVSAIIDVIDDAYDEGIRTFMCTTHDKIAEVVEHVKGHQSRYDGLLFYPCMPYAHKYANAVTELGAVGALRSFLPDGLLGGVLSGGKALASKDVETMVKMLVDAEMRMFDSVSTPVVFLQNVVVDLCLGLRFYDAFRFFADHVVDRYGAEPGFITMNLVTAVEALRDVGIENPIVCSNLNKLGFRVSGGIQTYDAVLAEGGFRPVAMSVFASGAIPPREALEWVRQRPGIGSIVFGASSRTHIRSTFALVEEIWAD
jgi:hypothetical protein